MPPETTPSAAAPESEEKKSSLEALRTYKLDTSRTIRERDQSLASMALAEQARRRQESREGAPIRRARKFGVFLSLALLIGGGLLVWGVGALTRAFYGNQHAAIRQVFTQDLLFSETKKIVVLDAETESAVRESLAALLIPGVVPSGNLESIKYVEAVGVGKAQEERSITSRTFADAAGLDMPSELEDALSDDFFIGAYDNGTSTLPILVFSTTESSYSNAFAGMLSWESIMYGRLAGIFGLPVAQADGQTFTDAIIQNKDARVLLSDGEPLMYYAFPNQTTIIITPSKDALEEAFRRLAIPRQVTE